MSESNMSATLRSGAAPSIAYAASSAAATPAVTTAAPTEATPTATPSVTAPAQHLQPQPSMANKQPSQAESTNADTASPATYPAQVMPASVPHLVQKRSEKQILVRTATVTRSLYQIPATLKCAQLAELGKGTLTIKIETRAQLAALGAYLQDGPVLKDGTPVHALKLECDFEALAREKSSEWKEPGALLAELMDCALCVKSLDLGGSVLRDDDIKALGRSLSRPEWKLEVLCLNGCLIGDDAAQALAKGLTNHASLKNFSLQGTYMLEPSWRGVLGALASCRKLETLVIHPTAAGNLRMDAVALILANVASLRSLSCSCALRLSLYPEQAEYEWRTGFGDFCDAVAQHPGLRSLDLKGSELSPADIGRLVRALEKSSSVQQLGLGDNQPDAQQTSRISTVLTRNASSTSAASPTAATANTASSSTTSPQKQ